MQDLIEAGATPRSNAERPRSPRLAPQADPDALRAGIRWGLLFSLLGFWLPLGFVVSRGVQAI